MKIFFCFFTFFLTAAIAVQKSTFRDTYTRYLSGHDLLRILEQKFPRVDWSKINDCDKLSDKNRAAAGDANPANGEMVYRAPSAAFVRWYSRCALGGIQIELDAALPDGINPYFGPEAIGLLASNLAVLKEPKSWRWNQLSEKVRAKVLTHLIHEFIGPGVMKEETILSQKIETNLEANQNVFETLKKILFFIVTQDQFLTY